MPIYEYRCGECERTFEKLVAASDNGASSQCPTCGEEAPKLLSMIAARTGGNAPAGGGCCGGGGACACAG
jgi:putative FmdB family regulatory protein